WVESQRWSDGSFGLYGSSYMGVTTLQAAVDAPHGLKAVFAYLTGSTYQHGWFRSGGVFELAINVRWTRAQLAGQVRRPDRVGRIDDGATDLMAPFAANPLAVLQSARHPTTFADILA